MALSVEIMSSPTADCLRSADTDPLSHNAWNEQPRAAHILRLPKELLSKVGHHLKGLRDCGARTCYICGRARPPTRGFNMMHFAPHPHRCRFRVGGLRDVLYFALACKKAYLAMDGEVLKPFKEHGIVECDYDFRIGHGREFAQYQCDSLLRGSRMTNLRLGLRSFTFDAAQYRGGAVGTAPPLVLIRTAACVLLRLPNLERLTFCPYPDFNIAVSGPHPKVSATILEVLNGHILPTVKELAVGRHTSFMVQFCPNVEKLGSHTVAIERFEEDLNARKSLMTPQEIEQLIIAAKTCERLVFFEAAARWTSELLELLATNLPQLESVGLLGEAFGSIIYDALGSYISRLKDIHTIMLPLMIEQDLCYTTGQSSDDGHYSMSDNPNDLSAFRYVVNSQSFPLCAKAAASWLHEIILPDVELDDHVNYPDDIKSREGYNEAYRALGTSIFKLSSSLQTVWIERHNLRFSTYWDVKIDRLPLSLEDDAAVPLKIQRGVLRPAVGRVPAETHLPAFDKDNRDFPWVMNHASIAKRKCYESAPLSLAEWRRLSGE